MWHNSKWKKPKSIQYKLLSYVSLSLTKNKWYIPIVILLDNHLLKWAIGGNGATKLGHWIMGGNLLLKDKFLGKLKCEGHCLVKCEYSQPSLHDSVGICLHWNLNSNLHWPEFKYEWYMAFFKNLLLDYPQRPGKSASPSPIWFLKFSIKSRRHFAIHTN